MTIGRGYRPQEPSVGPPGGALPPGLLLEAVSALRRALAGASPEEREVARPCV